MSSFSYLRRNCPICDGARTDCRKSETTNAIHCRATGASPAGWEATGFDAHGFTIWIESSNATSPNYWAERERQRQQRAQEQAEQRKRLLSVTDRDRQWRRVAGRSGLAVRHREALEGRYRQAELSPSLVDRLSKQRLIFSWQAGESVPGVTAALPGTDRMGRLRNWQGLAIAAPDHQGRLLGYQIKPDSGEGYFWAASRGGNGPHLPNGELPIGIYRPSELKRTDRIGLAEGFLKPAIASERLGIPFIGAAGGNFASSPEQFRAAVEALRAEMPEAELVLYPDAGMLDGSHRNVQSGWRRLADLCDEMGISLQVCWWGQTEKIHGDVDEAPAATIEAARHISMVELEAMVREVQQEDWRTQYEQQAKAAWERCRRFTPTQEIGQRYVGVEPDELLGVGIHALKSDMGTGKTQALATLLAQSELGAIAIGSRNSLLLQSCERWGGFYHLHQDDACGLVADPRSRIACCVDSLLHFADRDFDGKIIILDESLSVVKHALLSSTLKGRRDKILAKFEQAIKRAAIVIAWDGNNADIAINYLASLRGEHCRVVKALNAYRADRMQIEMVRVLNEEGKPVASNHAPVLNRLGDALRAYQQVSGGPRALIAIADSQRLCEALDQTYSEQGFNVLRIDAKTVTEEHVKRFLANPDAYIADYQPDLLVMSPTAESGIDISIRDYFARGFAFFFGVIDTATQLQFLRRVRHCLDWSVWCTEYTSSEDWEGTRSPFARHLNKQFMEYLQADAIAALKGSDRESLTADFIAQMKEQAASAHHQTTLQFMAARNYERQHTRRCLQIALSEAGHQVRLVDVGKPERTSDTDALKQAREQIIESDSRAIFSARDITTTEAARIKGSFNASVDDRWAAEKALLKARLPGIEHSAEWSWEFVALVLFKDQGLIKRLERWWLLNHMDVAKAKARETWLQAMDQGVHLTDIRSDFRLLQALNHLNIVDLCDGQARDASDELVQAIYQKCRRSKKLQAALGKTPGKLSAIDWAGRLCRIVGITSSARLKPRPQRGSVGGERWYAYHAPGSDTASAAILTAIGRRLESRMQAGPTEPIEQQGSEADHLPLNMDTSIGGGAPPIPIERQGSEADSGCSSDFAPEDLADVRALLREAEATGPDAVAALRKILPPALWQAAA